MKKNDLHRRILENLPDAVWVCDTDFNFTYVSPAIETISGYTCEEKMTQGPGPTMTTKSATGLKTFINEKLSTIEPDNSGATTTGKYQCELLHKDGSTYPVESHIAFIHDDNGQVSEIIGINRDITERINAENIVHAYHRSTHASVGSLFFNDLLKFLCETLKIRYAFIGKIDGEYLRTEIHWSNGAIAENINYRIEGSPCEEVVKGKTLFIPNKLTQLYPRAATFSEWNIQSCAASPIQSKEGGVHSILVLMDDKPMESNPLIQHLLDICSDRVGAELARQAAEKKLAESEEKFHSLFEHSLNPCIISSYDGHYIDANAITLEIFGYTDKELHNINIRNLFKPGPEVDSLLKKMRRSLQLHGVAHFHGIFKKQSGEYFPGKATASLITLGQTKIVQTHIHDLSEAREAEDELLKLSRAMNASASIVIITDLEGKIEYINPKFTQVTGYTKAEVIGKNPKLLKSGETSTSVYQDLWAIIAAGGEWRGELHNRKKDGAFYWCRNSISAVKNSLDEITHYISVQEDITQEYKLNEQLNYQACHDALTGLINRTEFERRTQRLLARMITENNEHALCFMDLDQFKVVNDTCGHIAGDELLRQLGSVLKDTVRHSDTLARIGGDEFAVLMEYCPLKHAERIARALQKAVQNHHFSWEGHTFRVSASIGLVPINKSTANLSTLLSKADSACYMAKDQGRNRIHVYHPEDQEIAQRRGEMQWITRIYRALEEDHFCLFAQAIEPLSNSASKHYEILIRMKDENGQIIPPGAFLPAAERYNIITQIDRWVTQECCRLLVAHPDFLQKINFISINLSGQSLTDNPFLDFVIAQLQQPGIDCEKICFEITETAAIANLTRAMKFISTLKGLGCKFALDDFGSGLSSFAYLKNLPVDYLKIDGMFVKGLVDDPIDHAMVKSINEIGQIMGMETIAEFVENDEIKGMLREIGVNYVQGYGIGKPQSFDLLLNKPDSFN